MTILFAVLDFVVINALIWSSLIVKLLGANTFFCILIYLVLALLYVGINVYPARYKVKSIRLAVLKGGSDLLCQFMVTVTLNVIAFVLLIIFAQSWLQLAEYIVIGVSIVLFEAIVFWNGIIRTYLTSVQLGIKQRVLAAVLGLVPIVNIIFLIKIIVTTALEYSVESEWQKRQEQRKAAESCKTKYPILLVHGVFFRDSNMLNYWGRVPEALEQNGAAVYYGNQRSASSVVESAAEIAKRIAEVVEETGCEKVNIIAHSKGGLDSRYAISNLGMDKYVATLTTVNTPHKGCIFVDYLFNKIPEGARNKMAGLYNGALKRIGEDDADFIAAVRDLTETRCKELNEVMPDMEGVSYRSIGSMERHASSGTFPLNVSYPLVKHFDGDNDGLVAVSAMKWGESFDFVSVKGKRGVTHADMIDLNRENIKGFDVREYYVGVVSKLREQGF